MFSGSLNLIGGKQERVEDVTKLTKQDKKSLFESVEDFRRVEY